MWPIRDGAQFVVFFVVVVIFVIPPTGMFLNYGLVRLFGMNQEFGTFISAKHGIVAVQERYRQEQVATQSE